jgi:hypothetical protein
MEIPFCLLIFRTKFDKGIREDVLYVRHFVLNFTCKRNFEMRGALYNGEVIWLLKKIIQTR